MHTAAVGAGESAVFGRGDATGKTVKERGFIYLTGATYSIVGNEGTILTRAFFVYILLFIYDCFGIFLYTQPQFIANAP